MHGKGLEPLRLAAVEPKSTASANFATRAGTLDAHRYTFFSFFTPVRSIAR